MMSEKSKLTSRQQGIIFIILAAFSFSLMNMFVRLSGDLPSIQKSFFRNFIAMLVALVILLKNKVWFSGKKENIPYLFLRSFFGTVGILCNFYAVDHLVLSDASMLNKMSPFFAILFSFLLLRETLKWPQVAIVVTAFLGSLLIIKPTADIFQNPASLIGLLGGFSAGLAYTCVRKLGEMGEKGPFIVFAFSAFSCLVALPFLIFDYHPMTAQQLLFLLLAGVAAAMGQFSVTAAYFHAPAREISVYDYSQILFSAILGFLAFGQVPDLLSWAGYAVIFAAAIGMYFYNNRSQCT